MREQIIKSIESAIAAIELLRRAEALDFIETAAEWIALCYRKGRKLLIAGNGGSLCDAMHFAEELTGYFRNKRKALPAIALADPAHITCVANDAGFESIFSRGVEAFGKPEDVLIILTSSGNSPNLVQAVITAKKLGLKTVAFLGKTGGRMKGMCDLEWYVQGPKTSDRIQEAHMTAIHILIEIVEKKLFSLQQLPKTILT